MADDGVYTTNASIQALAGVNANTTAKAIAATDVYVLDIEALVNIKTNKNWSDAYAALNVDVKGLLHRASASLCAINVIQWDMDAIGRGTAESMIMVLLDMHDKAIKELKGKSTQAWMVAVT